MPVIGCDCAVCASDDPRDARLRTSALLRAPGGNVLVDCGPDARQQLLRAGVRELAGVLLTHEHNDHVIGLDDLRPFMFRQRSPVTLYAEARVLASVRERFGYAFAERPYPGAPRFELREIAAGDTLELAGTHVEALRVEHGRLPILGFRVGDLAYLTDAKTLPETTLARLGGLATLVLSALHHTQHHSHLTLAEAVALARRIGARRTYFIHASHAMGLHAAVDAELPAGLALAYDGLAVEVTV